MPRKKASLQSIIAEHEKYRRQCQVRIRPSLTLCAIAVGLYALLLLKTSATWLSVSPLILLPAFYTVMEIICFITHDRALRKLRAPPNPGRSPD